MTIIGFVQDIEKIEAIFKIRSWLGDADLALAKHKTNVGGDKS